MLFSRIFISITFLLLTTPLAHAQTIRPTTYSPYADLTRDVKWNSEFQDLDPIDLTDIGTQHQIKAFHLGFITDAGSCEAAWGGFTTYAVGQKWAKRLTDAMDKQGIETTISFGGASGNDLSMNCNAAQLLSIFDQSVDTYKAKKLDFDIENGTANVPKLITVLKAFQETHPTIQLSLTLPVMPDGLALREKDIVSQAIDAHLNFSINLMTMDFGESYSGDMGVYTKEAATALHLYLKSKYPNSSDDLLWQKIYITPMIGVNDVPSEQFTLANAKMVKAFATENHLGGISIWSINRDKPCLGNADKDHCSGHNIQQKEYEFSHIFNS
jgi:hypothetical protein